ncbi:MAG: HEAT repeat domain-containing protein [Planctomycetota bacterium]
MKRFLIIGGVAVAIIVAILLNSLVKHGEDVATCESLIAELGKDEPGVAKRVSEKLRDDDISIWFPMLIEAAGKDNPTMRRNAITVLGHKENIVQNEERSKTVGLLMKALDDDDVLARREAVRVITARYGHRESAGKLREIIKTQTEGKYKPVAVAALEGLGLIAGEGDADLIKGYLSNAADLVRFGAVKGLGNVATVNALRSLLEILPSEKNLVVRTAAIFDVGKLGEELRGKGADNQAVEVLDGILKNEEVKRLMLQKAVAGSVREEFREILDIPVPLPGSEEDKGYALEKYFFFRLLVSLYQWNEGDRYTVLLSRLQSASGDEQDVFEGAVTAYIDFLLNPGGKETYLRVKISEEDITRLRQIGGMLIPFLNTKSKNFAADNLRQITGKDYGYSESDWQAQFERYAAGEDEFKPAG